MERKTFDSVDIAKFIGSILIFAMHMSAFDDFGKYGSLALVLSARWGVPVFFLLHQKNHQKKTKCLIPVYLYCPLMQ